MANGWSASGPNVYVNGSLAWSWDADKLLQYPGDLNPLAMQLGAGADGVRDSLAQSRDNFSQPLFAQYRAAVINLGGAGFHAPEDDYSLLNSQAFQNWLSTGQLPVPQAQIDAYQGAVLSDFRAAVVQNPSIAPNVINDSGDVEGTDALLWQYVKDHYQISDLPSNTVVAPAFPQPAREDALLYADLQTSSGAGATGPSGPVGRSTSYQTLGGGLSVSASAGGRGSSSWLLLALLGFAVYKLTR